MVAMGFVVFSLSFAWGQPLPPPPYSTNCQYCGKWAGDIFFEKNFFGLTAEQRERLARVEEYPQRKGCPYTLWVLVGHADPDEGSSTQLKRLASARARNVANLLEKRGVPARNICVMQKGGTQPLADRHGARVEMELVCASTDPSALTADCTEVK
jgi:hypothetical protein